MNKKTFCRNLAITILCCGGVIALLCILYLYDNKYTTPETAVQGSTVLVSQKELDKGRPIFLISGWELYPDQLLDSSDFSTGKHTPVNTYIGEYPTLSPFHEDLSPYGEATYRYNFTAENPIKSLTLSLPEIFCAFRVYVNGELVGQSGSLNAYKPKIQDMVLEFPVHGKTEIILQTANNNHYYSGLYYPPAIGTAQTIHKMISSRLVFYGFLCFTTLAAALYSMSIWLQQKSGIQNQLHLYLGILAFSFSIRVLYPFLRLFGVPLVGPLYALEDICTFAGIYAALKICCTLTGLSQRLWCKRLVFPVALGMCVCGAMIPGLLLPYLPAFTSYYGFIISWYKLITALFLIAVSIYGAFLKSPGSIWLLEGSLANGICLFSNIIQINHYEPIYTGWQDEYGAFILVVCFAVLMSLRNHTLIKEHAYLTSQLTAEVQRQTQEISGLVNERQKLLSELLHDLKSPMASIYAYIQLIQNNKILLDKKTSEQLNTIADKCDDMNLRMAFMQELTINSPLERPKEQIDLKELLSLFYEKNKPDVEAFGPDLRLLVPNRPCMVMGSREKLDRVLQNLVYNAVDFTPDTGQITLVLEREPGFACLRIKDTGCGIPPENREHIFNRFYTTRKEKGTRGMGLYICKNIITEHGGTLCLETTSNEGTCFAVRIPLYSGF